ncbi:glycosyl transferase [Kitasatospora herbaricolor]|uniref:glycosyltransferase n=1 Tax=Kitasatospora herbaricolor TaxID=68217 RepID=UPI00174AF9A0|nr:glycosyltransferase [Kitasatospora herbaricolor]MDQ0311219.1 glycosyltransferase involved in cell wall biosynthesis [Kitasatospora herbaricolor]GGV11276.1 glycosyl transferase [Kitasatospora herbaricolor]
MRVLHIVTGLASGGAERQLLLTVRNLPAHQHCEVLTLTNPGAVAGALRADGVPVHDLAMRGNRDVGALPRLVRLIRAGRYDLVHTHLYRAGLYGRLAARLAGVRAVVATEHSLHPGVIEGRPVTRGVKGLYLAAERLGRTTVAVSRQVEGTLHAWGVPPARVELIPNGIDAARYAWPAGQRAVVRRRVRDGLGLPQGSWVIGAVGRLVPGKRFDVLLDALRELDGPRLVLIGEGPERPALERRAGRLGVRGRVLFTGERDDVPDLLAALDVLAAPSTEETFGLGVLEGLAAGLPVRHSACPALDELPPAAAPGALRIPSDPAAYASALRELYDLRATGTRPLAPAPAVARYDAARAAAELGALYDRLVPRPASAPAGAARGA